MEQELAIEAKYQALCGRLDEATLRLWAATEARSLGRGGVTLVAKATGLSRTTIHAGLSELKFRHSRLLPAGISAVASDDHNADGIPQR